MPDAQGPYCPSNTTWKYLSLEKEKASNIFSEESFLLKLVSFDIVHIYNKWNPGKFFDFNQKCRTDYSIFMTV